MMNTPVLISVIIPVYNAADYLRECLESLARQTFASFEVICVDDGSTDSSTEIINEYIFKDSRFKLIMQQNQYAGVARQNGMSEAKGKYYAFMDADDFVEPDMLKKMWESAEANESDIVVCGVEVYQQEDGCTKPAPWLLKKKLIGKANPNCFNPAEALGPNLYDFVTMAPWAKIFRADFVKSNNLTWAPLPHANDVLFVGTAIALAEKMSIVDEVLVHYRVRSNSISHNKNKCIDMHYRAYEGLLNNLVEHRVSSSTMQAFKERLMMVSMWHLGTLTVERACELRKLMVEKYEPRYKILNKPSSGYRNMSVFMKYKTLVSPLVTVVLKEEQFSENVDLTGLSNNLKEYCESNFDFLLISRNPNSRIAKAFEQCASSNCYCTHVYQPNDIAEAEYAKLGGYGKYHITYSSVSDFSKIKILISKLKKLWYIPCGCYHYEYMTRMVDVFTQKTPPVEASREQELSVIYPELMRRLRSLSLKKLFSFGKKRQYYKNEIRKIRVLVNELREYQNQLICKLVK